MSGRPDVLRGHAILRRKYGPQCLMPRDDIVKALLERNPDPTEEDMRHALSGNLCRCTGYNQMFLAIKAAVDAEKKGMAATR